MFVSSLVYANDRYFISFSLAQNGNVLQRGSDYVTSRPGVWNSGQTHSYLKLQCEKNKSGKLVKLFSTVTHFDGVRLTHRLVGDQIEVNVLWSEVKNRRAEIHKLGENECSSLSPIVTTITQSYTFPANIGVVDIQPFGETMNFKLAIESGGKMRVVNN